ncbi:hypothetical protein NDU88_005510 [Pleurodeles waltl]|uniref:Uncharacterized protein n=1 Tax=Pleurodeles waltl TaxID=8319 RepID=A0AAV7VLZ0_PLEWA|nr:hypothetical protein NDU88_005510 [Pleurodeles waltl]
MISLKRPVDGAPSGPRWLIHSHLVQRQRSRECGLATEKRHVVQGEKQKGSGRSQGAYRRPLKYEGPAREGNARTERYAPCTSKRLLPEAETEEETSRENEEAPRRRQRYQSCPPCAAGEPRSRLEKSCGRREGQERLPCQMRVAVEHALTERGREGAMERSAERALKRRLFEEQCIMTLHRAIFTCGRTKRQPPANLLDLEDG